MSSIVDKIADMDQREKNVPVPTPVPDVAHPFFQQYYMHAIGGIAADASATNPRKSAEYAFDLALNAVQVFKERVGK